MSIGRKLLGVLLLVLALAVQVGLALLFDVGLNVMWSGTASQLRLVPYFSLAVGLTIFVMALQYWRTGAEGSILRHWRWFGIFWIIALLSTCAVGG